MTSEEMSKGWEKCSLAEAVDELNRECNVRIRCFPKWVTEGRISGTEARDRLSRLLKAGALLAGMAAANADGSTPPAPF